MTFPALIPSARTYSPGNVPESRQITLSGVNTAYRLGSRLVDQRLELSFSNISEADLLSIRTHYLGQDGSYGIFYLPPSVWSGYTTIPVPAPSNIAWRYAEPPVITDGSCDLWSVEVRLQSYVIDLGDLIVDAGDSSATPARDYIYDGLTASATPARDYVINSGASR